MNDADNTQDRGLTTDQTAAAGTQSQEDIVAPGFGYEDDKYGGHAPFVANQAPSEYADRGATDADMSGSFTADSGPRASLLEDGEQQSITMRWKDIQAEFVDEPTRAVQEADALVAELMQRLAAMFAAERSDLEMRWGGGNEVSTEDLRQGLRRYRSFFERLLAA